MLVQMFSPVWYWFSDRSRDVAMATNFRREIGRNRRHAFLPGTQFHNGWQDGKADGRVNSAEVLSTSYNNLVNFGPLTPEFTVTAWRSFMRQMRQNRRNAFDSWNSHLTMNGRNRSTDLRQIHMEDVFGYSLGRVWMSRSKVKDQSRKGQKTRCALTTPAVWTEWNASLQIKSRKQQTRRFDKRLIIQLAIGIETTCTSAYLHSWG